MSTLRIYLAVGVAALTLSATAEAQIPSDEYLRHVPLTYPRIIRQTEASARFHLYGDRGDPAYRDVSPKDGIDDARGRWLQQLTERFAPIMVLNTPQFPMDFRHFYSRDTYPLFIERWDIARADFSLVDEEEVDFARLASEPCPAPGADNDDCRLLELIERFGPTRSPLEPEVAAHAERETFTVLHFDQPGYDEKTWKEHYWPHHGQTVNPEIAGSERVFAHPFVAETPGEDGGPSTYELVIQYWFFYPANDGPNNHEGDWEHINVVVSPLDAVDRSLDEAAIARLVAGQVELDGANPLVLKRVEYYLHHYIYAMDFSSPNAYAPRSDWLADVRAAARERGVATKLWERVRERAWRDQAETMVNTQPVVWIGGDAVGLHNVLEMPGLKDQDGHPSYPFRGYYKQIGPGNTGERAIEPFDHFDYFAGTASYDHVVDYQAPGRVAVMPDWEHVFDLSLSDADVRREWSWMLLPIRFGYPASPSPGAGLIAHADLGNVAPIGPTYNNAWNRVGDSAGYEHYDLVEQSWMAPMSGLDSFFPRAGFLNAPILYFMLKPPLDLAWRTLALPVRAVVGNRQPTFLPANAPAIRDVSFEVGPMITKVDEDFSALFFTREQFPSIFAGIVGALPPDASNIGLKTHFGWASAPTYSLVFHLSPRFSTESSLVWYDARVGFDFTSTGPPVEVRGDFSQFEYLGTLRFNLKTGSFQPYLIYGTGITGYQLKNVTVNDELIDNPTSPKFRPAGRWWNLGFNETAVGGGVDWHDIRVKRVWIGAKVNWTWMYHNIGFERLAAVEDFPFIGTIVAGTKFSIWRQQVRMFVTIGW